METNCVLSSGGIEKTPMPSCMSWWLATISAVRLLPSENHCPRVTAPNSSIAVSSPSDSSRMPRTLSREDSTAGISGTHPVPPILTPYSRKRPASRTRPSPMMRLYSRMYCQSTG